MALYEKSFEVKTLETQRRVNFYELGRYEAFQDAPVIKKFDEVHNNFMKLIVKSQIVYPALTLLKQTGEDLSVFYNEIFVLKNTVLEFVLNLYRNCKVLAENTFTKYLLEAFDNNLDPNRIEINSSILKLANNTNEKKIIIQKDLGDTSKYNITKEVNNSIPKTNRKSKILQKKTCYTAN